MNEQDLARSVIRIIDVTHKYERSSMQIAAIREMCLYVLYGPDPGIGSDLWKDAD